MRLISVLLRTRNFNHASGMFTRKYSTQTAPLISASDMLDITKIRNVAIIAHVDHGKTTLVDSLLKQCGSQLKNQTRVMDSNDLEKERGITILSKATSILYNGHRINIVDTPGHADFGGEVERVLAMVDGVVLVVCATDGPMAQTKYVLEKALARNLKPLVVLNKADRPSQRSELVDTQLFDLFLNLGADDSQMEYPLIYASAKMGWSTLDLKDGKRENMNVLFNSILDHVPHPQGKRDDPFSMLVTQIEMNNFVGKCYLGKITSGTVKVNDPIHALDSETSKVLEVGRVTKLLLKDGMESIEIQEAGAGDIVTIAGISHATVNSTICNRSVLEVLPSVPIDPPTVAMTFAVNDSPFSGQEGKLLTSTQIKDRLLKEAESNVALDITPTADGEAFEVRGRGELQLGILIETMRREGFELTISPPRVVFKGNEEPIEEVVIDVNAEHSGWVINTMTLRKGEMGDMFDGEDGRTRMTFTIPTRGLIGFVPEFKNVTFGTGVINRSFLGYEAHRGVIERGRKASIVSMATGETTTFSLHSLQQRGKLFVESGVKVYGGMIIGEYNKEGSDLDVNPVKAKELTNVRAAGKETTLKLSPIVPLSLEDVISYIQDDEAIEVTPLSIRMRKVILDANKRGVERKKIKDRNLMMSRK